MSRQISTKVDISGALTERIEQVREELRLSRSAFCRRIGFSASSYSQIAGGRHSKPSAELLTAVATHTHVNPDWLLSGQGLPYRRGEGEGDVAGARVGPLGAAGASLAEAYVLLPLYSVQGGAGEGAVVDTEEVEDLLAFKREWITHELRSSPDELSLIYVRGESMVPTLNPGDVILIERNHRDTVSDGIYVIRMGEAILVKRLQFLPESELMVTSDNAAYQSFRVTLRDAGEEFSIIGRVVWAGRRF